MKKTDYLKYNDAAFSAQLTGFKNGIGVYGSILGLTAEPIASQAEDADYYAYALECTTIAQHSSRQWTAWKGIARHENETPDAAAPMAPVMPTPVPAVAPGIEARFRELVRGIKANPAYNVAMGLALGIEGAEQSGPDYATITPEITATISGGRVHIGWGWQGHGSQLDMIEIHVDRGNGDSLLTYDTTPGYDDTTPFPATPTKWTYKAIYRKGDQAVGQWSNEVSVIVGG